MVSKHFDFEFEHEGKTIPATCDVYTLENIEEQTEMPYKYPVYRVAFNTNRTRPSVFLYYEINEPDQRFYWYPIDNSEKRQFAQAIVETLERIG